MVGESGACLGTLLIVFNDYMQCNECARVEDLRDAGEARKSPPTLEILVYGKQPPVLIRPCCSFVMKTTNNLSN